MKTFLHRILRALRTFALIGVFALAFFISSIAHAILDAQNNGMSDLWEKQYNNGNLFPATFLPTADDDQDGWDNVTEAVAGTDPKSANPPEGIIATTKEPAATAGTFTLTWNTIIGKNYRLQASSDLTNWLYVGTNIVGTSNSHTLGISAVQPDTTVPPKLFWRIVASDLDTDTDGLTNAEENTLGTDPNSADSDGDTHLDKAEILAGTNPLDNDTDEDGIADNIDTTPLANNAIADPDGAGLPANLNSTTADSNGVKLLARYDFQSLPNGTNGGFPSSIPGIGSASATDVGWDIFQNPSGMPSFTCRWNATSTFNEYLSLPYQILDDRKTHTWSYWLKLPKNAFISSPQNTGIRTLLSVGINKNAPSVLGTSSPLPALHWYCDIAAGKIRAESYQLQIGTANMLGSGWDIPAAWNDGEWHHIALTKSDAKYNVYFDGSPLGEKTSNNINLPLSSSSYTLIGRRDLTNNTDTELDYRFPAGTLLDRLRCYAKLTPADVLALYNQDIDNDGLYDRTEARERFWYDKNNNNIRNSDESEYVARPFQHDEVGTDHDRDGIASHSEQNSLIKTNASRPDTDGDLMIDGWEIANGLNPLVNDAEGDLDNDGASNIDEYRYASKANSTDSDGDGTNDSTEITQGSHPNDARDGGQPIPVAEQLPIFLGVGDESDSHSEDYVINCFRIDPATGAELPYYVLRSGGHGLYEDETVNIFRKEDTYTFQIKWISSSYQQNYNDGEPDFDYTFKVTCASEDIVKIDSLNAKDWSSNHAHTILRQNADDVTTFHDTVENRRFCMMPKYFSINEFGQGSMTPGLAVLKGKVIHFHLSPIDETKWNPNNILTFLYSRKMQPNMQYGEWSSVGAFSKATLHHTLKTDETGIFQFKAEIRIVPTVPVEVHFRRISDEKIGNFEFGNMKKGDLDAVGVCEKQIQLDLLHNTQAFYGSLDYDFDNPQPAAYGFPAMDAQTLRCNMFIAHRGVQSGADVPKINGLSELRWPPLANEWAGIESTSLIPGVMTTAIANWKLVTQTLPPEPGWVIAHPSPGDSGHCGIIDYNGNGIGAGVSGSVNTLFDFSEEGTSRFRKYEP